MTRRIVKNEQWCVHELINKIDNGYICKPKYQRKKKWSIKPTKDNNPDEHTFIRWIY
jgi:hypothetical protein